MATVNRLFQHTTRIGQTINKLFQHRTRIGKTIVKAFKHRLEIKKFHYNKIFEHSFKIIGSNQRVFSHRFMIYPYADPVADPVTAYLSEQYGIPPIEVATHKNLGKLDIKFLVNGQDIGCVPYQFTINMSESQPTTWALNIMDSFGTMSPLRPSPSPWHDLMDEKTGSLPGPIYIPPTPPGGIPVPPPVFPIPVKTFNVHAIWGGMDWSFSGIPQSWSHTRNWETRYFNFTWKGTDHSVQFNRDTQTMKTVKKQSALVVLKEILGNYGVNYNMNNWNTAEDFYIPVMQRQSGNPMEWITQILGVRMMEWKMENGNVFTPYYPNPMVAPTFVHDFGKMEMLEESYEGSCQAIINKVIVLRAAQSNGAQSIVDVFEFKSGYSASFSPPVSQGYYSVVYANNGVFTNFHWMKDGAIVASREVMTGLAAGGGGYTYGGAGQIFNCDSVEFEWHVAPGGFIGTGSPGRIEFHGTQKNDDTAYGEDQILGGGTANDPAPWARVFSPDPLHSVFPGGIVPTLPTASQAKYGVRQIELTANPLIPNSAVAQVYADRYIFRVGQQARFATYRLPLNPHITPGCVILEIDEMLGVTRKRIVTAATHNFSNDPGNRYTSFTGIDYSPL